MKKLITALLITLACNHILADSRDCEGVQIADMNWESATFVAHVDQFILEHGYDCTAELVPANTQATGAAILQTGKPEIIPEFWWHAMKQEVEAAVASQKIIRIGSPLSEGGIEGFWIPEYMYQKAPELNTINGVIKNINLFSLNKNDGSKIPFYGCPKGWNCHISSKNLFEILDLDKAGFEYRTAASGPDLAISLQEAYEKKQPWFGYYWSPTPLMGKHKMTLVDFGSGINKELFESCMTKPDCKAPKPTMYPAPLVQTVVTTDFARNHPGYVKYLSHRGWTDAQMNELLAWMEANQADGDAAMEHFLKNYQSVWVKWVDGNAVRSIRKALRDL
ncbi:ABC transporter substrate-binding protein [Sansalvadorimonas sp. 2012CJ34-2]|uniref:ABC transporter substrate-binding protein n=1 Tax=Parendozoicomonas callyspongiae TaxID=2942213 RepID=A0ABT0PCX0_9GAMM|nr:glycine betaine ABC transporter substrate-binding protein [Sansalvadorimonas sp. 2012CJ34-2]MCL6269071.1 ABC transporter substrate-binding protein [Sansalvadorimonas sp. 2012CJ34-2]